MEKAGRGAGGGPEAEVGRGDALRCAVELADGCAPEDEGAEGGLLAQAEAIGGAGEEGVLGDLRAADEGGVLIEVVNLGVAIGAAQLAGEAEVAVEVVGGVEPEGDLAVLLGELAGAETEIAAAAGDLPAMSVGFGDLAGDARLAVGVGRGRPGACSARERRRR